MNLKSITFVGLALIAILVACPPAVYGTSMWVEPDAPGSFNVGETFGVTIGLNDVADLNAFQFDLVFDPATIHALSVSEGSFFGSSGNFFPGIVDNPSGTITLVIDSLFGGVGVDGSGILASISFEGIQAGTSLLSLSNVVLLDSNGFDIPVAVGDGSVFISNSNAVPEPSTLLLFGIGLTGLGVYRFRRQA